MIFDRYRPGQITVMFRPTGALFGAHCRNDSSTNGALFGAHCRNDSSTKKRTYEIIELLTDAYGAPVTSDYWPPLVISDGKIDYTAPHNSWYIDERNFSTSIYLTNEEQLSYLIIRATDVVLSTYQDGAMDQFL